MVWNILANLVLLLHLSFLIFVIIGGFFANRWRRLPWIHVPAAAWGTAIEFGGWTCPLTLIENWLRVAGGKAGYPGEFMEYYLTPIVYPEGLTPEIQTYLGLGVILINGIAYSRVRRGRSRGNQNYSKSLP